MKWNYKIVIGNVWDWALARLREGSTWAGLAMIAVVLGSDPMRTFDIAEAISLIIGGGLIARPSSAMRAGEHS